MREKILKNIRYNFRLTVEEYENLKYLSYSTGLSMSDVIRKALKMYYNLQKHRG